MSIQKKKSENSAFQRAQRRSEIARELREKIADFLMSSFKKITEDVKKLQPRERIKAFLDFMPYVVPKFKSEQDEGDFANCSDEQLDYLLEELKKSY